MNFNKALIINSKYYNWYCSNSKMIKRLYHVIKNLCLLENIIIKENKENYLDFVHMIYINTKKSKKYRKYIDNF
tara:strand:- start:442 stop:663 length:222 start_codon:yes stop_codon:yes gene_type:complete